MYGGVVRCAEVDDETIDFATTEMKPIGPDRVRSYIRRAHSAMQEELDGFEGAGGKQLANMWKDLPEDFDIRAEQLRLADVRIEAQAEPPDEGTDTAAAAHFAELEAAIAATS